MADTKYDAIVVGAGFGGSACAGLLARRGLNPIPEQFGVQKSSPL